MSLKTYTSSDNKVLATKLAGEVGMIKNIFQKHFIVTGHTSTNDFLTQTIAHQNGIAAHLDFKSPSKFVEMVYSILEAGPKRKELFKSHQLVWLIDSVLSNQNLLLSSDFAKINNYIGSDTQKRFALAEKIAGLFQSYQEDTPEIIKAWNSGEVYYRGEELLDDEVWQRVIWLEISKILGERFPDLTKVYARIHEKMLSAEGQQLLQDKLPSVSFFGNLAYTSEIVNLLKLLGDFIDISIFHPSFQQNEENRFVQNFGQMIKKQHELLQEFSAEQLEIQQNNQVSTLGILQQKIKGSYAARKHTLDDSIVVANSFTVNREIEAFYHYLILQFHEDEDLMKRDICVITPNIDLYSPAIQAFFTNKNFEIDYTLYDTSHKIQASPYSAIEALFQLESDDFTSKKVMSLLDFNYIRDKFGIIEDQSALKRAVKLANIRHGMMGNKEIETDLVSWSYGLKRLIYGFCLAPKQDEVSFDDASFFPVDQFEESETRELMRFVNFVDALYKWLENRDEAKTLNEWLEFIEKDTIDLFIDFKEIETNKFRRVLGDLKETANYYTQKISFRTIRYYLLGQLNQMEGGERKGYGGVQFVSPNTYLSNPAKIYAFLGMNGKDFPRQDHQLSFDLNRKDRTTITEMDKNLFLNCILTAEKKVYFSFIGQSVKDNSQIPPSTLIDELMEGIKEISSDFDAKSFIVKHPLHGFSKKYNNTKDYPKLIKYNQKSNANVFESYFSKLDKNKNEEENKDKQDNEEQKTIIYLHELINFINDPVKHYFNKTLGIYYNDREIELAENELFELGVLENWGVKDAFLKAGILNKPTSCLMSQFKKRGLLPLAKQGEAAFYSIEKDVDKILNNESLKTLLETNERKKFTGEIEIENFIIKGSIDGIYDDTFLFASVSKNKAKYQIKAILQYYFGLLSEHCSVEKLFYFMNEMKEPKIVYQTEKEPIIEQLSEWCNLFVKNEELIPYTSEMETKKAKFPLLNDENYTGKLNSLILYETILNDNEQAVFLSDYFKKIAENDGFLDKNKATRFLEIHVELNKLIAPLK
jgi:exodeoxyribonuclease V gamma subunit